MLVTPTQFQAPGWYPGPGQATLLRPNTKQYLLHLQAVTGASNGTASIGAQIDRIRGGSYPLGASMAIKFTDVTGNNPVNPGAFQIDWQNADEDTANAYVTISSLTSGLNGSDQGRIEISAFWADFIRANVVTITNPCYLTILASR